MADADTSYAANLGADASGMAKNVGAGLATAGGSIKDFVVSHPYVSGATGLLGGVLLYNALKKKQR